MRELTEADIAICKKLTESMAEVYRLRAALERIANDKAVLEISCSCTVEHVKDCAVGIARATVATPRLGQVKVCGQCFGALDDDLQCKAGHRGHGLAIQRNNHVESCTHAGDTSPKPK